MSIVFYKCALREQSGYLTMQKENDSSPSFSETVQQKEVQKLHGTTSPIWSFPVPAQLGTALAINTSQFGLSQELVESHK